MSDPDRYRIGHGAGLADDPPSSPDALGLPTVDPRSIRPDTGQRYARPFRCAEYGPLQKLDSFVQISGQGTMVSGLEFGDFELVWDLGFRIFLCFTFPCALNRLLGLDWPLPFAP